MKTLNGITYFDLFNCSTEELNIKSVDYAVQEILDRLLSLGVSGDDLIQYTEKLRPIAHKHILKMFNSLIDHSVYEDMRRVYDTEARFNIASEMETRIGKIRLAAHNVSQAVFQEFFAAIEQ